MRRGYRGLAERDYMPLDMRTVSGILHLGGTILCTSSYDPFREGAVERVTPKRASERGRSTRSSRSAASTR